MESSRSAAVPSTSSTLDPPRVEAHPEVFPTEDLGVVLQDHPDARGACRRGPSPRSTYTTASRSSTPSGQATAARDRFRDNAAGLLVSAALGALDRVRAHRPSAAPPGATGRHHRPRPAQLDGWTAASCDGAGRLRSGRRIALAGTASRSSAVRRTRRSRRWARHERSSRTRSERRRDGPAGLGALPVLVALPLIGTLAAEGPSALERATRARAPHSVLAHPSVALASASVWPPPSATSDQVVPCP